MTEQKFDLAALAEVSRKARLAEQFIIEEAAKMGIKLDAGSAQIFSQAVLKAYGLR